MPVRMMRGLIDRLLFTIGLLAFLQIPQFVDHYVQRYGGYRQALSDSVEQYRQSAERHYDGDLLLMIQAFKTDEKPALRELGGKIEHEQQELSRMDQGWAVLQGDSLPRKLLYLAGDFNVDIARGTAESFSPGLPLTLDAMICGLLGGTLVSLLFNGILGALGALTRRPKPRIRVSDETPPY
ncbi:MAG: DUF2937 family protein [Nevskiales bacterium]|nr:DUF2937 family protein [Nevskiales bacterium]